MRDSKNILLFLLYLVCAPVSAALLQVPAGVTWSVNGSSLAADVYDLEIAGTLVITSGNVKVHNVTIGPGGVINAGNGLIRVSGNWANMGNFHAGTSRVEFIDGGLSPATLSGNTTFYDLAFVSGTGKTFRISPDDEIVVSHDLLLRGTPGSPVVLATTQPGRTVTIQVGGAITQEYVFLQGVSVQQVQPPPITIPTLDPWAMLLLVMLLIGSVFLFQRPHAGSFLRNIP